MSRGTCAEVDLAALRSNYQILKRQAPNSKVLAVVKADAYGHGLIPVAQALPESDGFGVAILEEAVALRRSGIAQPIVLLEGVLSQEELQIAALHRIAVVVHHQQQLDFLENAQLEIPLSIWLKFNTGMHRLGLELAELEHALQRLRASRNAADITLMSHFACADEENSTVTAQQFELFSEVCRRYPDLKASLANSGGVFRHSDFHFDWVRPGIALYGCSPLLGVSAETLGLKPVMQLRSKLIALRTVVEGESVGYGATWVATKTTPVGIVGIGYGDGYPRHIKPGTVARVGGVECELIGRVSMDMMAVDLSNISGAQLGDDVLLWGEGLPVEKIAESAGTINYELLCHITHRAERRYLN